MTTPILEADGLVRHFRGGDANDITVLNGVSLKVWPGEFIAITGASGSGKSTLLHLLGALDYPDRGEVLLKGQGYARLPAEQLADLRNRELGFIFQFHHLLRDFTARENVMMPLLIAGVEESTAGERAEIMLAEVGLTARADFRVTLLSGGEQQRVALARALVTQPALLLADEPTGNLDLPNAARMHELLVEVTRKHGVAVIAVTHNPELAERADQVLVLDRNGLHPVGAT